MPATLERIMTGGFGVMFVAASFAKTLRAGTWFGRGDGYPPTRAQRAIIFLMGVALLGHALFGWFSKQAALFSIAEYFVMPNLGL